jgi:hypothetical protein
MNPHRRSPCCAEPLRHRDARSAVPLRTVAVLFVLLADASAALAQAEPVSRLP